MYRTLTDQKNYTLNVKGRGGGLRHKEPQTGRSSALSGGAPLVIGIDD